MATIGKTFTFASGAVILAASHNTNFDTIYNDYNGNITNDNIAGGAGIEDSKLATIVTSQKVNLSALVATSQAQGDVVYASGATTMSRLGAGTDGQFLKTQGAAANPIWSDLTASSLADGTDGEIITWDSDGAATTVGPGTVGQVLTSAGAGAEPSFQSSGGLIQVDVITSDGNWSKPAGCNQVLVKVIGGGGGGGGTGAASAQCGGGGGGGYSEEWVTSGLAATEAVLVGAAGTGGSTPGAGGTGGTSSFGTDDGGPWLQATGGAGGATTDTELSDGGAGGVGSDGDINVVGGPGGYGVEANAGGNTGGSGGNSVLGGGAVATKESAGAAGGAYGGGGSGSSDSGQNGGAGAAGVVIVYAYN